MASTFSDLCIDCSNPQRIAEFWSAVVEYPLIDHGDGFAVLEGPGGIRPRLVFLKVPERKTVKNRLHIDVTPVDRTQEEEVARLESLGAKRIDIGQGDDVSWVVLADPDGNEFCVLRPGSA